jgi:hypothetical protein
MPLLVRTIIAPGFASDPQKYELTVALATIMFPYLMCMSLAAMMAGMLNSLRRYFAAAIAPVFLNVILIAVLGHAWYTGADSLEVGYAMAWGVMAAGVVQLAIVWIAARRAGISIGFRWPHMTPNVKRLLWLALPAAITGGITQINTLIGTAIASGQDKAVPALAQADRFYQLPLGVVGIAVAIVLLPELARALKAGNDAGHGCAAGHLRADRAGAVRTRRFHRRRHGARVLDPRRIRPWLACIRAHQGVHAGLFRPRGYEDADGVRRYLGGHQHHHRPDPVPAHGRAGHCRGLGRRGVGQRPDAARRADPARSLGA